MNTHSSFTRAHNSLGHLALLPSPALRRASASAAPSDSAGGRPRYACMYVTPVCVYVCDPGMRVCMCRFEGCSACVCVQARHTTHTHIHTNRHTFIHPYINKYKQTYIHTYLRAHTHTGTSSLTSGAPLEIKINDLSEGLETLVTSTPAAHHWLGPALLHGFRSALSRMQQGGNGSISWPGINHA